MATHASLAEERLWEQVKVNANEKGCSLWTGHPDGMIRYSMVEPQRGQLVHVRRLSYLLAKGEPPPGHQIDYVCGEALCVRPDHLDALPRKLVLENRGSTNGNKSHCPKGHPYDEANTYYYNGSRQCRTCGKRKPAKSVGEGALDLRIWLGHPEVPVSVLGLGEVGASRSQVPEKNVFPEGGAF